MTKLEAALDAARRGFSVFPLVPNAKTPALKNWQNLATTDKTQIEAWWAQWPEANIGITTERLLVVDIDPRNGGKVSMVMLYMTEPELPHTLISDTQGGGHHVIFNLPEHTAVSCGKNVLGSGIDIKSSGGYIVAPGSTVEGRPYKWAADRPLATAPQWLLDLCRRPRSKSASAGKRVVDSDDVGMALAVKWIESANEASEGERDNVAFAVAARLYDFGLTKAEVGDLVALWNDTRCDPPLEPSDLARIAESAGRNRDKAIGSAHPLAPGFDAVEIAPQVKPTEPIADALRDKFYILRGDESANRAHKAPRQMLVDGLLQTEAEAVMVGAPGGGKTFLGLDGCYHIAKGLPWFGRSVTKGATVYIATEAQEGINTRVAALEAHYGALGDTPMFIIPCPADLAHGSSDTLALIDLILATERKCGVKVVLVVIDTLARAIAGGDDSNAKDMGAVIMAAGRIRRSVKTSTLLIHHPGKDATKGARGSSHLLGAVDTEMTLKNHTLRVTKQRDMVIGQPIRFKLESINVGTKSKPVWSCYVTSGSADSGFEVQLSDTQSKVLAAIDEALKHDKNRVFSPLEVWEISLPHLYDKTLSKNTIQKTVGELCEAGKLVNVEYGQYRREY